MLAGIASCNTDGTIQINKIEKLYKRVNPLSAKSAPNIFGSTKILWNATISQLQQFTNKQKNINHLSANVMHAQHDADVAYSGCSVCSVRKNH